MYPSQRSIIAYFCCDSRMDWLIRELNVDYVAKETIQAMMTNTQTVTLPRLFYPVCVIKSLVFSICLQ